ncbi:MAG: restriction endonuclease subunit S [Prolixibacteraceae bacterium]|nr:restriction endonuclease subunit S [Prolixibacteraceae bacterium]
MNTIIEHIALWTTAQTQKSLGKKAGIDNISWHGINRLRELILELAIQGKLVEQDSEDEPANILFHKINKEKKRLIAENAIKKTRQLPVISEEEFPFKLPRGWIFARLNDLGDWGAGATPLRNKVEYYNGTIPWFKSGELNGDYISESEESVTELALKETSLRYNKPGDVLIAMYGATIGKASILKISGTTNQAVCACTPFSGFANIYLLTLLKAYKRRFIGMGAGGAQPNISREKIIATVVALPPLAEQHRIVAKVDELMALCDQLEQQQMNRIETHLKLVEILLKTLTNATSAEELKAAWQHLEPHFDLLFTTEESIDLLKQTILQLAVMGKLVPQDPSDEPASVLLKKIETEKNKLIKAGKLKKQNPLPEITEDEKPFELPKGWEWARFPEIGEFGRGKSKHRPRNDKSLYSYGKYPLVQTGDVARADREITTYTALYNDKGLLQSRMWPKGTMCITIAANIADSGILGFDACFPDSVVGFIPFSEIRDSKFFEYFIRTAKDDLTRFAPSTAQKNINLGILESVLIPIPPAKEIEKIVAKLDELMTLCDQLKERIVASQQIKVKLADAVVERALNTAPHKEYEIAVNLDMAAEPGIPLKISK